MSDSRDGGIGSLADMLKAARQKKGLTLKELAEDPEVGVSATFLSRIERTDALPSDELLLKIARKLEIDATSALMHLFRDRASPEVREHVPLPSVLKVREGTGPAVKEFRGLEAIAEPISQVLDLHRELLTENARLSDENARLVDEVHSLTAKVAEEKRRHLPDVNRFLISLFNYESEVVRRDLVISRSGGASMTVTIEGVKPKRGSRPIQSLVHEAYIPQSIDGSLNTQPARFKILEQPEDLRVEFSFEREAPERGWCKVLFPDGFYWSPSGARLSYSFSYRLEKAFVMTLEDAKAVYGRRTVHDPPLEWSNCLINKPVRRLEVSVTFPEGYSPGYVDKWVWWTETSFLDSDYNLSDRLLVDPEDGIEIEQNDRTVVRLRAQNPLLGFSYGIVWQPLSKRQFLALIKG